MIATQLVGHSAQGQTVPLYLRCLRYGESIEVIAKLAGKRSNLRAPELVREFLGNALAQAVGLHVSPAYVVELPPDILADVEEKYAFGCEDGHAFGSLWAQEAVPYAPGTDHAYVPRATRARLLALDLVLLNGDRTPPNPNVLWDDGEFMVFDFEHALELPNLPHPERFARHLEALVPILESHLMRPHVREADLERALVALAHALISPLPKPENLPEAWESFWRDMTSYGGYIGANGGEFLSAVRAHAV